MWKRLLVNANQIVVRSGGYNKEKPTRGVKKGSKIDNFERTFFFGWA